MNERLKQIRSHFGMSQAEFSKHILVGSSTLAMWEIGTRTPKDIHISKICSEFGIREEWFRNGIGEMFIENDNTIISELSNKYSLDSLDVKILESYLKLSGEQRKAIKKYVYSLVDTILEDDELYQDYRGEYIEENSQLSAARNGNTENIEEAINLYDNLDDTLER
ncbi:helix-turn-helix domain-containing protein [Clostridioides sp. ZZV14-6150]|uniref:helix-turn-helix domain-containing protein n=1 Tax=unclassified Clostridioides TaxID=2635829 RepID=UPI001D1118CD|nr:helix-turn-helix domain-containing protein [Clostridioides sp. ZZV14-6150]MCC0659123.1 helix-turn-helix domain-containing protein [Clostridioides sp. ZZV14-6154]MCC0722321.1 helix-turn-helix domain-containing protein [Clostridioides sp. ZZV14-6104]